MGHGLATEVWSVRELLQKVINSSAEVDVPGPMELLMVSVVLLIFGAIIVAVVKAIRK
jgi:hypothetical protein